MTHPLDNEFSESAHSLALKEFYETSATLFTSIIPLVEKSDADDANAFIKHEAFEYVSVQLFHQYKTYAGELTSSKEIAADIIQHSTPPYRDAVNSELKEDKQFMLAFENFCLKAERLAKFPAPDGLQMESFQ